MTTIVDRATLVSHLRPLTENLDGGLLDSYITAAERALAYAERNEFYRKLRVRDRYGYTFWTVEQVIDGYELQPFLSPIGNRSYQRRKLGAVLGNIHLSNFRLEEAAQIAATITAYVTPEEAEALSAAVGVINALDKRWYERGWQQGEGA